MIIRIVKMTFREDQCLAFKALFEKSKSTILSMEGCLYVELLQDKANPKVFMTYSHWVSEDDLNKYRYTEFFRNTWSQTKALFSETPVVYSMDRCG